MNILHLLYDDPLNPWVGGGGAVRAREVYGRLAPERGFEITLVTGRYPGAVNSDACGGDLRVRRAGLPRPYALSRLTFARAATRLLERGAYDVAVVDFSVYTPLRLPSGAERRTLGLVHHVTGLDARARWGRLAGGWIDRSEARRLRSFQWISVPSHHTLEAVRDRIGQAPRVDVIGNGVDPRLFSIERRPASPPYFLYLGRIDLFHKGLDLLLTAFERVAARAPAVELRIAGGGKDLDRLRSRAEASGVAQRIRLHGRTSEAEKHELLAAALCVVIPSRMEGWGMVAAEAMAASAPVVASDAGALPEVVGADGAHLLVPAGDAEALTRRLEWVLEAEEDTLRTVGAALRDDARQRHSWDAVALAHGSLLETIYREGTG